MSASIQPVFVIASYLFWFSALYYGKKLINYLLLKYAAKIDLADAYIPTIFPVVDPPGKSVEFDRKLDEASEEEIEQFLDYRGFQGSADVSLALEETIKFRQELCDYKVFTSFNEIYTKGTPGWPHAMLMNPWSSWKGFYLEMGPNLRKWWLGNAVYSIQHGLTGLIACVYLFGIQDPRIVVFALYSDLGFNLVDLSLMVGSLFTGKDITIFSGYRTKPVAEGCTDMSAVFGTFKGLIVHHLGASVLECVAIHVDASPGFVAEVLVAMLGTTGMLHFYAQLVYYTPLRLNKKISFLNYLLIFLVFSWYRGILWLWLMIKGSFLAFTSGGAIAGIITSWSYAFFSLFNYHGVVSYFKSTKREWKKWVNSKSGELYFNGKPEMPSFGEIRLLGSLVILFIFELLRMAIFR